MKWEFLINFWVGYNLFLVHVLSALPAEAATVVCAIGKNPPATLEWIAQDYVAHLKHHLNQILGDPLQRGWRILSDGAHHRCRFCRQRRENVNQKQVVTDPEVNQELPFHVDEAL